jgi:hypothetical protein
VTFFFGDFFFFDSSLMNLNLLVSKFGDLLLIREKGERDGVLLSLLMSKYGDSRLKLLLIVDIDDELLLLASLNAVFEEDGDEVCSFVLSLNNDRERDV